MNRVSNASGISSHGSSWIKVRYLASERSGADDDEHVSDNGNNQDGSDDGVDFNELAAETSSLASSESGSFVCCEQATITAIRVRPMLLSEKKSGYRVIVDMSKRKDVLVTRIVNPTALPTVSGRRHTSIESTDATGFPAQFTQEFWFDYSYWSFDRSPTHQTATQSTISDELGVLALQTVLQGHNCSVLAYGQPGAGKTYTMMGSSGERALLASRADGNNTCSSSERRGLIPRICQGLFEEVDKRKSSGNSYTVLVSYVEIHDERVYDLLSHTTVKQSLKIREHPENGVYVEGVQCMHATSYSQLLELIEDGNCTSSVTSMHKSGHPTRSHTVLTISLTQHERGVEAPRTSKLCLVDLAASERVDHSDTSGSRLREASSVNRSLATLASVLGALAKRKCHGSHQKTFAPYRNSVLTRLLKDCLGGRAKAVMIGMISPCCAHYEESIATLRCVERARSMCSTGRLQAETSGATSLSFLRDVNELKSNICASNETRIPSTVSDGEDPEHNDKCSGCESCDDTDVTLPLEEKAGEVDNLRESDDAALNSMQQLSSSIELKVHMMNMAAIRRRWQSLHLHQAWNRWVKLAFLNTEGLRVIREISKGNEEDIEFEGNVSPQRFIGRNAGCPPLHTGTSTAETRTADRVHDVVAAVVATDAICCSVVQDFLHSHHPESPQSSMQKLNTAASASLLEQLASSSEFDRTGFSFDNCGDFRNDEPHLEGLASPEGGDSVEENNDSCTGTLSSFLSRDEESGINSKLSLCLDSIDIARRALGPGVYSLKSSKMMTNRTGVECELLRYLDKRFIAMEWSLDDLMVASQLHPLSAPLSSTLELLETMVGEFCLQIIPKLCDQLPSASSACIAGRHQLETQLDHFGYRLRRQLLPEISYGRDGSETDKRSSVESVLSLATELIVMTERIKIVWNLSGHKKRERLLQAQALEAAVIQNRTLATKIVDLEERNAELNVTCSGRLDKFCLSANDAHLVAMEAQLAKLQQELEDSHCHTHRLKSQIVESKRLYQEQVSELENVKQHLFGEKDGRVDAEAKLTTAQMQVDDLKHQLAHAEGRFKGLMEAESAKSAERWQVINVTLMDTQAKNAELSAAFSQAKEELSHALENASQGDFERTLQSEAIEKLKTSMRKAQILRESAEMSAEDSAMKHADLKNQVSVQANQISVLERSAGQNKQRLLEVEAKLAAFEHERDEHTLLISQTEEALASALNREQMLRCHLAGSSAHESEEMNRIRCELHEATLELASLREELAELLDHSTLQSSTIETLTMELSESLRRAQELELERDELELQCQVKQNDLEQKTRAYDVLTQQSADVLSRLERQQEIEREGCMAVHEALQRQTIVFQKLQARQHSIKMDYYSTIRDLKGQVETMSAQCRALNDELVAKTESLEAIRSAADARIRKTEEQAKLTAFKQEEIIYGLTEQLQECRADLKATIIRWIRAETQCGVLRVCNERLDSHLIEMEEGCTIQLADAESSQLRDDHRDLTQTELASDDAWFDEVISDNPAISTEIVQDSAVPQSVEARDEERLSMLKTLTDLTVLTNELLGVCETSSNSTNLSIEESSHAPEQNDTSKKTAGLKQELMESQAATQEDCEVQKMAEQREKALSEVIYLRKTVMKLKEALDAKDDMLMFLDRKVRRLEQL